MRGQHEWSDMDVRVRVVRRSAGVVLLCALGPRGVRVGAAQAIDGITNPVRDCAHRLTYPPSTMTGRSQGVCPPLSGQ